MQELGKMALNELPYLFNKGTNKIKNKKNQKVTSIRSGKHISRHGYRIWTTKK